jgi:hypothetical protein
VSITALLIPADDTQPVRRITVADNGLEDLQAAVGGRIEALPYYADDTITTYVNEEGKFGCEPNTRATQLLGPGLLAGDYVASDLVVCGFDPDARVNLNCPEGFETRLHQRRKFPQPNICARSGNSVTYEWALGCNASGEFRVATLSIVYETAGVNRLTDEPHADQFCAVLANRTHHATLPDSDTPGALADEASFCREEVTDFSRIDLAIFANVALERLSGLYAKSDPRITRFFCVNSGAAL